MTIEARLCDVWLLQSFCALFFEPHPTQIAGPPISSHLPVTVPMVLTEDALNTLDSRRAEMAGVLGALPS